MRQKLRLRNRTHFTLTLLALIALSTAVFWHALIFLPKLWGWPLESVSHKRYEPSAAMFHMMSLICGGIAGATLTDWIRRGRDPQSGVPFFLKLYLAAVLAMGWARLLELSLGWRPSNHWLHGEILGFWLANLYLYALFKKYGSATSGSNRREDADRSDR